MNKPGLAADWDAGSLLAVGLASGIFAGFVEGAGLLFFQRLNWARWGPMIHVSGEIVWISPLVDAILFLALTLVCIAAVRLVPRLPAVQTLVLVLAFFSMYDWLTVTGRLTHRACFLLALGVAVAFARWSGSREVPFLRFWKRTAPWMLAAGILAFAGIQGGKWLRERSAVAQLPPAAPGAPNVLVIVFDTLRADHVSSYGYARRTGPNFDRMAQQGVLFENAISTTSWSLPSHVSLLEGRYQFEHGIANVQPAPWLGWGNKSLGGFPILGEVLQQKGYRTGAFSANRTYFTTSLGFGRGFQHFEDYFHSPADMFIRTLYGREFARLYLNRSAKSKVKRALRFLGMNSMLDKDSEGSGNYGGAQGVRKRADVVNEEALHWIDAAGVDRARNDPGATGGSDSRPFFAFLNYFDVHYPYGGPPTYPKPAWDRGGRIDEYDASVKYTDDALGRLMQALDQRGIASNILVILTSDHGESLGQHGLTYHGQALYRELIHVPLVIWWPGHVPAGMKVAAPVTNAAIPATILDLLDAGTQQNLFPISSLSALWQTGGAPNWPDVLSELARNDIADKEDKAAEKVVPTASTGSMKSLVTPQWQLITHESMGDQLYDWTQDPAETNNLVQSPSGQATASGLKSEMDEATKPRK